jgi:hypothetical protein
MQLLSKTSQHAMIMLPCHRRDDLDFILLASRLITGTARLAGLRKVVVVRVDYWFGDRWLGFQGKFLGAAGVREKPDSPSGHLCVPPFHPHRVRSELCYRLTEEDQARGPFPNEPRLHGWRSSESNLRLTLEKAASPGVFGWYNGDTRSTSQAALMVYTLSADGASGWYASFEKAQTWQLKCRVGIGDAEWEMISVPRRA